jgi:alpha-mannosidase
MALDRRAEEFQTPAEYVVDSAHDGHEPWEKSFLSVQPANIWVLAVKAAEDGSGSTIVRLQERSGRATTASVNSTILGLDHAVSLGPWELKTLRIRKAASGKAEIREVSLLEV